MALSKMDLSELAERAQFEKLTLAQYLAIFYRKDPHLWETLKSLHDNGDDLNSLFRIVIVHDFPEIFQHLVGTLGVKISPSELSAKTRNGHTLLHSCCFLHVCSWGLEYLLEAGANPNEQDLKGRTVLYLLVSEGCDEEESVLEAMRLLFKYGADPNIVKNNGNTALHYAVRYGYNAFAQLLLENGARCDLPNKDGKTALDFANGRCAALSSDVFQGLLLLNK